MPCVAASLATADARFPTSRSPMYAIAESTARDPSTRKMSAAAGMSARTLPFSPLRRPLGPGSRMAGLRIEAVDREPGAIRVDDLGVPARRLHDAATERADERHGQR